MIKHIVVWKLKESADGFSKKENAERMKAEILKMKESVPVIKHIEAGINILDAEDSFDVVLLAEFENEKDLQTYQNHPGHVKFKEFIKNLRTEKRSIDYEY